MRHHLFWLIPFLFLFQTESTDAQINRYEQSRNFLGVQGGHTTGLFSQLFFNDYLAADISAGYIFELEAVGSSLSILGHLPVGALRKNRLYLGGGYFGSISANLSSVSGKLGYRYQLANSPFFLYAEWTPWFDRGWLFKPISAQLRLSYAFKEKEYRNQIDGPLNGYYDWAIGVKAGTNLGVSARVFTSPRTAFNITAQYETLQEAYNMSLYFSYNQPLGTFGLFAIAGVGGGVSVVPANSAQNPSTTASHIGLLVGLEYNFFALPVHIGFQVEPNVSEYFGVRPYQAAGVVRYIF